MAKIPKANPSKPSTKSPKRQTALAKRKPNKSVKFKPGAELAESIQ